MGSSRDATHEHVNASALADARLAADRARTRRFPHLLARKVARMSGSPLGFLRGSAMLSYEILGADRGAVRLAGLHEAVYLAFCDRTRGMAAPRP